MKVMTMTERYPFLGDFLKHYQENLSSARRTIEAYEGVLKQFFDWMLTNYGFSDPTKITKHHIFKYRDYCYEKGYRTSSISQRFTAVRQYFTFLEQTERIKENNFPERLSIRGIPSMPAILPTPEQIFRIRLRDDVKIEQAFFFELGLSSGMRSEEMAQLRACDFNFDDRPYDKELKQRSPYFVGSIQLKLTHFNIKQKHPRTVYFSSIAAHLWKQYIAKFRIDPTSTMPIYPWSRTNIQHWIRQLGIGIVEKGFTIGEGLDEGEVQRERGFIDISPDQLIEMPKDFRKLVERRQDKERNIEDYKRKSSQPLKGRKRVLHPHSLRHAFTNFAYYRNPLGERLASDSLRLLLGHTAYSTTFTYLRDLNIINEDRTWIRLWIGKPDDWSGINR